MIMEKPDFSRKAAKSQSKLQALLILLSLRLGAFARKQFTDFPGTS